MSTVMAPTLAKQIRFYQLFAIGFGTMIGIGWIIVAGNWITLAGPGGAVVAFGIGAAAVLVIGLVYAEMGSTYPFAGGEIVYVFEGLGTGAAFFLGWLLTLSAVAICAFEAVASGWLINVLVPITSGPVLYRILGSEVHLGAVLVGNVGLLILIFINFRGGFASATLQNVATWTKVVATAAFVFAALTHGKAANREPFFAYDENGSVVGPILALLATVPVWYGGFNTLPQALGEISDLRKIKNLSTVMTCAILAGFVFFALVILATASPVPRSQLLHSDLPVADALFASFPSPWPGRAVLAAGLMGIITSWNAWIFCGARVLFSLSRARMLPAVFAQVHPRFGSPAFAAVFIGLVSAPIALLGRNSLMLILNLVGLIYATGYLLVALSLRRSRAIDPDRIRPCRMPGHPYFTGFAALLAATFVFLAAYNIWHSSTWPIPSEFIALALWLALGAWLWRRGAPRRIMINEEQRRSFIRQR